jgi:putative endonuclease
MPYTYVLFSQSLDRFYIGSTELAPDQRLKKHLSNHAGFTAKAKGWNIVFCQEFQTIADARRREMQLKKWKSKAMIEKLIAGQPD